MLNLNEASKQQPKKNRQLVLETRIWNWLFCSGSNVRQGLSSALNTNPLPSLMTHVLWVKIMAVGDWGKRKYMIDIAQRRNDGRNNNEIKRKL